MTQKKPQARRQKKPQARRQKEAKMFREITNQILLGDDPQVWIDVEETQGLYGIGIEMSLWMLMDSISKYIEGCFLLNDNPLQHLRKLFPSFIWEFHEGMSRKLASVLGATDYIWSDNSRFITATQIGGMKRRVLCFLPKNFECPELNDVTREDLSHVPGIRFVQDGNDKDATTIIT